jgi:hypothetical protein
MGFHTSLASGQIQDRLEHAIIVHAMKPADEALRFARSVRPTPLDQ